MARLHELTDEKFMTALFRNLARQRQVPVTLHIDRTRFPSTLFFDDARGREPRLHVSPDAGASVNGNPVRIAFVNRGMFYSFESRLNKAGDNTYGIEKPPIIYSSFKRVLPRHRFRPDERSSVSFHNHPGEYPLVDLSTEGCSFLCDKRLWGKREAVRNITVCLDTGVEICVDGQVRYYRHERDGRYLYGLRISEAEWFPRHELFDYIAGKTYPNIRWMDEFSGKEMYALYDGSGYLRLKSPDEMERAFAKTVKTYDKLRNKRQISATAAYCNDEKILTAGSVLRIYDRTFLGHQLASLPEARLNLKSKTDVYLALADLLIDHPYCENYLTYFDVSLPWHHELYKRIGTYIDDSDKFIFDGLEFFECTGGHTDVGKEQEKHTVEVLASPETFLRYCEGNMEPLEMRCYAYDQRHFSLRETRQVYEVTGLHVTRRLWSATRGGTVRAYAVAEAYSEGLNLFNVLDMCRVYFVDKEGEKKEALKSLMPHVALFFAKYGKERFYVVFKPHDEDRRSFEFSGFEHRHAAGRVMVSKPGIVEYRTVLSMNSGHGG